MKVTTKGTYVDFLVINDDGIIVVLFGDLAATNVAADGKNCQPSC
jgi:hypothetical protein